MKDSNQVVPVAECVYRGFNIILLLLLLGSSNALHAQCKLKNTVFLSGEKIFFDVYFKWGLLMPKAGTAVMSVDEVSFEGKESIRQRLTFRTTSMFDHIFKMRDTIDTHFSMNLIPLQYEKRADEDGYFLVDRMTFQYKDGKTYAPTIRYDRNRTKVDTTHIVDGCFYDLLSVTMYLRTLDMKSMDIGDEYPTAIGMGKDIIQIRFRYAGQSVIERGGNIKYKTLRFYMDVYDEAFTQTKEALEIWVSDDENHIPIKIRAKLKIGAAEVYFNRIEGNRHPFKSRVVIPRR